MDQQQDVENRLLKMQIGLSHDAPCNYKYIAGKQGVLKFDLPEYECEFIAAIFAMQWTLTVFDIDQFLRDKLKYGHDYKRINQALEGVRKYLHQTLGKKGLNLDMIV